MEQFRIYLINLCIFQMYAKYENQYLFALFIKIILKNYFTFLNTLFIVISYIENNDKIVINNNINKIYF